MRWGILVFAFLFIGCVSTSSELPKVARAIDGDTLELENGSRVRLIGVNTPERGERLSEDAKRELQWLEGSRVRLERDVQSKDRYGRILSYVWFEGELVNKRLVEKGLAHVYRTKNKMHQEELLEAEERALREGRGIWERSNNTCIELLKLDREEEFFVLENICPYGINLTGWKVKDEATKSYEFQSFQLGALMLVSVHSGKGVDNQTDVYWNRSAVWNNDYDRMFLRDSDGLLVVFEEY